MVTDKIEDNDEQAPVMETLSKKSKVSKPKYDVTQDGYEAEDLTGFSVTLQEVDADNKGVERKVTVAAINWQAALTITGYDNKSPYTIEEIDVE